MKHRGTIAIKQRLTDGRPIADRLLTDFFEKVEALREVTTGRPIRPIPRTLYIARARALHITHHQSDRSAKTYPFEIVDLLGNESVSNRSAIGQPSVSEACLAVPSGQTRGAL